MRSRPPRSVRGRRLPVWLWVMPLVLAAHGLLFWAVADRRLVPEPRGGSGSGSIRTPRPEPNFSARVEPALDSQTGAPVVRREFTVPTRLDPHPPALSPAPLTLP